MTRISKNVTAEQMRPAIASPFFEAYGLEKTRLIILKTIPRTDVRIDT